MTGAGFDALVDESVKYMNEAIEECSREWDFQSYKEFIVSLDRRVLIFYSGPKPPIICDIQVAGNYMINRDLWRWSWDNPYVEPALYPDLEKVKAFGEANNIKEITLGGWEAVDEGAAWQMTALAAKMVGAKSVYRAPNEPRHVFLLIMGIRWMREGELPDEPQLVSAQHAKSLPDES